MSGPRVVMFRHAPVDIDSRVKKFATTLHRAGYEPIIISLEPVGGAQGEFTLGGRIRVGMLPAVALEDGSGLRVDEVAPGREQSYMAPFAQARPDTWPSFQDERR